MKYPIATWALAAVATVAWGVWDRSNPLVGFTMGVYAVRLFVLVLAVHFLTLTPEYWKWCTASGRMTGSDGFIQRIGVAVVIVAVLAYIVISRNNDDDTDAEPAEGVYEGWING